MLDGARFGFTGTSYIVHRYIVPVCLEAQGFVICILLLWSTFLWSVRTLGREREREVQSTAVSLFFYIFFTSHTRILGTLGTYVYYT